MTKVLKMMALWLQRLQLSGLQARLQYLSICLLFVSGASYAQNDLESLVDSMPGGQPNTEVVRSTFKSSRVVNGHNNEMVAPMAMEFRISHRFGPINQGAYEFFGLDQAQIRLALEAGLTDYLMVGLGRSSFQKTYDGFFKIQLLRQKRGEKRMPISLAWFSGLAINTLDYKRPTGEQPFRTRLAYAHQLILASKLSERFSVVFNPLLVHQNLVRTTKDLNTVSALGFGGRARLTKRISFNAEYFLRLPLESDAPNMTQTRNPLSVGFDIETGGHVFQLHVSNAVGMIEPALLLNTTQNWGEGGLLFGFNITREFSLSKNRKAAW